MGQIAIFETRISQYLQTILSSCHGWRLKLEQNSCAHAEDPFLAELQRAKRASEVPWVRKIGNPSSRENLVMTSAYERPNLVPRVLSLPRESTLVTAGHVSARF